MNKLNKLVTNYPVTLTPEEVENLSLTLSAVETAGGGTGGKTYHGDNTYIGVDNTNNTIRFLNDAVNKLESVSSKLDTSAFNEVSGDFLTQEDLNGYATKTDLEDYQEKGNYLSANALDNISGTWENVTAKLDTTAFSTVSGNFLTAHQSLTDYYTKSQTSGASELSAAFNDILKYNVTAAAGIEITTATDNGTTTFGISMTAEPVVTDTTLSGYNGIAATRDGEVNNQWNIGLTQDMLNTINGKLDSSDFTTYTGTTAPNTYLTKTSADTLYQPTGNYVTTADVLTGTDNTLTGIKIGSTNYTIPTTDLSNYYTKTQVDSTFASATQLNDYLTTAKYQTDSATFLTGVVTAGSLSGNGTINSPVGLKTSAEQALSAVNSKMSKPTSSQDQNDYVVWNKGPAQEWTSFVLAANSWANDFLLDANAPFVNGNNGLSAGLVPGADNYVYQVGIDTTDMDANKQYAFTTTGWTEVSTPTIPAITAESGISADGYKIGLTTTAINAITSVSSKVDKPTALVDKYLVLRTDTNGDVSGWCDFQDKSYSKSEANDTFVATANIDTTTLSGNGKSVSTKLGVKTDVIATKDYVNSSFLPLSGGTVSGQLVVSGGSNFDQQFLKITRENVNGYARLGLGQYGALALKADDSNSHTTQVNISPNTVNDQLVQVQHNGDTVGYLIPAVTATTTAGLTNDGILHIILES